MVPRKELFRPLHESAGDFFARISRVMAARAVVGGENRMHVHIAERYGG